MSDLDFLGAVRRENDGFTACLEDGDLSAPVPGCGTWTLYDLADHHGSGNLWAAAAITERHGNLDPPPAPTDRAALVPWFRAAAATLEDALATDPDAEAWTIWPPRTVGFWRHRRAQESMVHRWDAEHTLGRAEPLDPQLAADGVAEVVDVMLPRQVKLGRAMPPDAGVLLTATDAGMSWTLGPGDPVGQVSGRAEDLLLALWRRRRYDDPTLIWDGDAAAARGVLHRPLTP
ncbi:MAG TPA: maleylpyruvate isomerase family mycothiol-dependent enzyme [Actinomycetes bacterium]|nr:maleylpyruvate isomerase family mycothiol-dependent enzyme [Actinomycetes bacterium]